MKFYFFNTETLEIESYSKEKFITEFSEKTTTPQGIANKYFFNPEDGKIYAWLSGKSVAVFDNNSFTAAEAEKELFELALEQAENLTFCESYDEAKEQAKAILEMAIDEEWEPETIEKLRKICS